MKRRLIPIYGYIDPFDGFFSTKHDIQIGNRAFPYYSDSLNLTLKTGKPEGRKQESDAFSRNSAPLSGRRQPYYRNKELMEWMETTKIKPVFLPPYSPNLNLTV